MGREILLQGQQGCLVGGYVLEGLQDHWVVGGGDVLTIKTICMARVVV